MTVLTSFTRAFGTFPRTWFPRACGPMLNHVNVNTTDTTAAAAQSFSNNFSNSNFSTNCAGRKNASGQNPHCLKCPSAVQERCFSSSGSPDSPISLYEKLGGAKAVEAAVDLFYDKIQTDERIAYMFKDTNWKRQKAHQRKFLTMVLGGPNSSARRLETPFLLCTGGVSKFPCIGLFRCVPACNIPCIGLRKAHTQRGLQICMLPTLFPSILAPHTVGLSPRGDTRAAPCWRRTGT